ncbi:MAG: hypothetical protein ACKVT1_14525 [Dehalococcoidia bacterium]
MTQAVEAQARPATNPLERLASAMPENLALTISVLARVAGAAALLYYAYDQDTLFPERHFPRTWVFTGGIAALALLSIVPMLRGATAGLMVMLASVGGGVLIFGGANLATRWPGVVAIVAGVVAWATYSAVFYTRTRKAEPVVAGLLLGSLASYVLIGICVFLVSN